MYAAGGVSERIRHRVSGDPRGGKSGQARSAGPPLRCAGDHCPAPHAGLRRPHRGFDAASFVQAGFLSAGFSRPPSWRACCSPARHGKRRAGAPQGIELENQRHQPAGHRPGSGWCPRGGWRWARAAQQSGGSGDARRRFRQKTLAFYSRTLAEAVDVWRQGRRVAGSRHRRQQAAVISRPVSNPPRAATGRYLFSGGHRPYPGKAGATQATATGASDGQYRARNPQSSGGGDLPCRQLLREERRGEMQDRLLKILNDNVGRLDRIVQDILDLGRRDRAQLEALSPGYGAGRIRGRICQATGLAPALVSVLLRDGAVLALTDRTCARCSGIWWPMPFAPSGLPGSVGLMPMPVRTEAGRIARHRRRPRRPLRKSGGSSSLFTTRVNWLFHRPGVVRGQQCKPGTRAGGRLRPFHRQRRYDTCQQEGRTPGSRAN